MKTEYILIDFDVIFTIQSSEFIKSRNLASKLKKTEKKPKKIHLSTKN